MSAVRDLAPVLTAVEIRSPLRYAVRGVVRDVSDREAVEIAPLLGALQRDLYAQLYCGAPPTAPLPPDDAARRDFEHQLSLANPGRGTWEPGWEVVRPDDGGRIAARKDGVTVYALPEQFRADAALAPGLEGRLKIGKEHRAAPGFYFALGDADEDPPADGSTVVRVYFHVAAAGAARLLAEVARALNAAGVPFRFKTLTDPRAYVRADAAVLYLGLRHYRRAERLIAAAYRSTRRHMRKAVPRFTRALAPGLGVAEDPGNGESFGQHRCRLVALGLWRAFDASAGRRRDRDESVAAAFVEAGLDPLRPHLGAGSSEQYELPAP